MSKCASSLAPGVPPEHSYFKRTRNSSKGCHSDRRSWVQRRPWQVPPRRRLEKETPRLPNTATSVHARNPATVQRVLSTPSPVIAGWTETAKTTDGRMTY